MKEPTPLLSPTPPPMADPASSSSRPDTAPQPPAPAAVAANAFNLNGLLSSLPPEMQRGSGKHSPLTLSKTPQFINFLQFNLPYYSVVGAGPFFYLNFFLAFGYQVDTLP